MSTRNRLRLVSILTIINTWPFCALGQGEEGIKWNENALSSILTKDGLRQLDKGAFPYWKVKQMTWPSVAELTSWSVTVDEGLKAECLSWVQKLLSKDQVPADIGQHLVAMEKWGLITRESAQKRLCDVFIVRFRKGSYVIHIQESSYNVILTVADGRLEKEPRDGHRDLVVETALRILNDALKPDPNSADLHVFTVRGEGQKISRVSWQIESVVTTGKDGKKRVDLKKAGEIGTTSVEGETDGRFVKFEIVKCPGAVKSGFDPYVERFKPKTNDEPSK
ncbi:MAG TPA: hypothetical protein VMW16_15575 [Sedimentisphaerales bacterium]|nr:hypothetical protein [Sedimentisphaerales bacterium]